MTTTIDIIVGKTGETEISVNGAKGKSCQQLTEAIEQSMGTPVGDRLMKPEFYLDGETAKIDIQQGE